MNINKKVIFMTYLLLLILFFLGLNLKILRFISLIILLMFLPGFLITEKYKLFNKLNIVEFKLSLWFVTSLLFILPLILMGYMFQMKMSSIFFIWNGCLILLIFFLKFNERTDLKFQMVWFWIFIGIIWAFLTVYSTILWPDTYHSLSFFNKTSFCGKFIDFDVFQFTGKEDPVYKYNIWTGIISFICYLTKIPAPYIISYMDYFLSIIILSSLGLAAYIIFNKNKIYIYSTLFFFIIYSTIYDGFWYFFNTSHWTLVFVLIIYPIIISLLFRKNNDRIHLILFTLLIVLSSMISIFSMVGLFFLIPLVLISNFHYKNKKEIKNFFIFFCIAYFLLLVFNYIKTPQLIPFNRLTNPAQYHTNFLLFHTKSHAIMAPEFLIGPEVMVAVNRTFNPNIPYLLSYILLPLFIFKYKKSYLCRLNVMIILLIIFFMLNPFLTLHILKIFPILALRRFIILLPVFLNMGWAAGNIINSIIRKKIKQKLFFALNLSILLICLCLDRSYHILDRLLYKNHFSLFKDSLKINTLNSMHQRYLDLNLKDRDEIINYCNNNIPPYSVILANINISYWIAGFTINYTAFVPPEFNYKETLIEQKEREEMLKSALYSPCKKMLKYLEKYKVDYIILSRKEDRSRNWYFNNKRLFEIKKINNFTIIKFKGT